MGGDEVQRIWKEYYDNLYNIDTQEQVVVHIYGFDRVWRANYFRGKLIRRTEVKVRVGKLKIWRLCNMAFESGVIPEDWDTIGCNRSIVQR